MQATTRLLWTSSAWILLVVVAQATGGDTPLLSVPAREVPLPPVSPQLQKSIAQPVPPLIEMPTTTEGWKQTQRQADERAAKIARQLASVLEVDVEPTKIAGVNCYRVTPQKIAPEREKDLLVHVHGGAYVYNGGLACTSEAVLLARACQMPVLTIDYRMPPDHPFPAAPDDVMAVWKAVLADFDPQDIVMGGTSAGGGLVMATMLRCQAENVAKPAAIFLGTPGADLTKTGDSIFLNAEVDHALARYEGRMEACLQLYADGEDLKNPLVSPLYGDLSGFPPTILVTGTRDLLLGATVRTHRKLRASGVVAELHVFEGMCHAEYLSSFPAPEAKEALGEIAAFFNRHLKQ